MPFTKGHKDLVPSEARKRAGIKISLAKKGVKLTEEHIKNMVMNRHTKGIPHYGHRGKLVGDKNPSKRLDIRLKISLGRTGIKNPHTAERNRIMSGEKSYAWKGGISNLPYPFNFNLDLKERIRERDNYTCQLCGLTQNEQLRKNGKRLTVNHIDFDKSNCQEDNLNTLCNSCNTRVNWKREYYTNFFKSL